MSLLVSASTTAPRAPYASSSHMNQNRSWPGVPNRYRLTPPRKLIRPKSMATVVVVFRSTPATSSMPVPRSLSCSSVRSGPAQLSWGQWRPYLHFLVTLAATNPATPLPFTLWPLSPVNLYSRSPW